MRSWYGIAFTAIVCVLLVSSCGIIMKSGGRAHYIYGEGHSPNVKSVQLARSAAAAISRTDMAGQVVERYNEYFEMFLSYVPEKFPRFFLYQKFWTK